MAEYRYHPHGIPIPEGWQLSESLQGTHHGHYSSIIKREASTADHWHHISEHAGHVLENATKKRGVDNGVD